MKHTQKMILVPADITEQHKPIDPVLNNLDAEMNRILSNEKISSDVKLIKYNQVLRKFSKFHVQRQEPHEISFVVEDDVISNEEILKNMPGTRITTAKSLLSHIRSNPNIKIESNGEIIVDGQKIFGSNIVDLVHDFSRDLKAHPPAVGAIEMAKALKRSNMPLELIGNKARLNYFLQQQQGNGFFKWDE